MSVMSDQNGPDAGKEKDKNRGKDRDLNAERAERYSSKAEREAIARGDYSRAGMHEGLTPGEGYTALNKWERFWAGLKGVMGGSQALGQVLGGGPVGLVSGAAAGKRAIDNIRRAASGYAFHDAEGNAMSGPSSGNSGRAMGQDRSGDGGSITTAATKAVTPTENPITKPVSVFDYFTTAPRKKLGYQSTVTPLKSKLGE